MSDILYKYIEFNFRNELEYFALNGGAYYHFPENSEFLLKIPDDKYIRRFEERVLSKVCSLVVTFRFTFLY